MGMTCKSPHTINPVFLAATGHKVIAAVAGVVLFAALTSAGALVRIPLPNTPVPMTLQTVFVILSGLVLGSRLGSASQALYIVMGIVGLPVFASGASGLGYISGPTAGYLLGFIVAPYVAGSLTRAARPGTWTMIKSSIAATATIFALGVGWLFIGCGDLQTALSLGLFPFLAGGVLKCGLAAGLGRMLCARLRKAFDIDTMKRRGFDGAGN